MSHINFDHRAFDAKQERNARKIDVPAMRVVHVRNVIVDACIVFACVAFACACIVSCLPVGV